MRKNKASKVSVLFMIVLLVLSLFTPIMPMHEANADTEADTLRIHYQRSDQQFENLGLWLWGDVRYPSENWPSGGTPFEPEKMTDYGAYVDIELKENAENIGFLVLNTATGDKDGNDKHVQLLSPEMKEIWIKEGSDDVFLYEPVDLPDHTIRIHYERSDQSYHHWGLWTWKDVASPSEHWPSGANPFSDEQTSRYGAYLDVELADDANEIGFLVVNRENGDKDGDDKTFADLANHPQLFIRQGDDTVYTNPYYQTIEGLVSGELISLTEMELRFTSTIWLSEDDLAEQIHLTDTNGASVAFDHVTIHDEKTVILHGSFEAELAPYHVTFADKTIAARAGWRLIDSLYGYDGELGAVLHEDGSSTLTFWSPLADHVSVVLYDKDDQYRIIKDDIDMTKGDQGVWQVTLHSENTGLDNLAGYYYHYKIERDGDTKLGLDPYAKSMAAWNNEGSYSIGKAAIVDPSSIGPELDFAEIEGFEKREDAIIYEVHVRDFTSDPGIEEELTAQFGTFASFVDKLDYIEDLGVTHIQLLPVMSYYWGDELANHERELAYSSSGNNYNWGYDPHSYFSLSGMYSENPEDPELRIKEFKHLIDEIHRRGMGVILDVVYNHTAAVEIFEDLMPNYYHFMDADGTPRTSFGGGRLGTTHKMSRRILVDSITYWVEEYKVDGFRFDMMGDHDAETIQIAYDRAKELNPNIVMIGEGWRTYVGDEHGGDIMPADQDWMQHTESVGVFSDEFRNELKSGFGSEGQPRFITGGARNIEQIFDNLTAQPHNFTATNPGDVVPYIEAHDNLTLHDVIAQSIRKDPEYHQEEIHKRIRLGNTMVLTAQGTAFLHAGQEFGRTKQFRADTGGQAPYKSTYMTDENGKPFVYPYFIHDSYDSSDAINKFDWGKATNKEKYPIHHLTRTYTAGLIELRRSTNAFTHGTLAGVQANVRLLDIPEISETDLVIGYRATSTDNTGTYYVFVNADTKERTLSLTDDLTEGVVIVDSDEAGIVAVSDPSGFDLTPNEITIDPLTAVIIRVGGDFQENPHDGHPGKGGGKAKGRPDHAGQPGPPPHAGEKGKPDHASKKHK
ncbi:pullulanase [Halalkalibacterium halodurans]|uniref:pullulanase n=2 Tax=Halalkalibacterium halodurans TaxID=86665 RepID=UPI002E217D6C|nr:pullulanase [Halalkalibacterium halodurans]MED4083049.1 pullulanase [Halalkalibacterium halodurans]MED4086934.1 pullulanase [Halalkalibacterium halodurans]MED4107069.1 pullulanase [Halalkalibacterium halodurans]MED4110603.1 pullulanase [Halalkalibacterium halodurans]MED4188693.1 pullulanase [Halalkalibacterium halodurans]